MPSPADLQIGINNADSISSASGYLTPAQFLQTGQGQQWLQGLASKYTAGGYGLPGGEPWGKSSVSQSDLPWLIAQSILNPYDNPELTAWVNKQGAMPQVQTASQSNFNATLGYNKEQADANRALQDQQFKASLAENSRQFDISQANAMAMANAANETSRQIAAMQAQTQMALGQLNASLQRDLQAGMITHQQAMQVSQHAHEKAMQAEQMAFQYAELEWTKTYGQANLDILKERLGLDREIAAWQKVNDERRVAVEEGRLTLEQDRFALDKDIAEAQLRANPYNAVANALYTRGKQDTGGQTQYGQSTTTLDTSGELPFLQQLRENGTINQTSMPGGGMYLNQGGIGGNTAPNPNKISQQSFGNMNAAEQGITTSLAQYGGWDPNDYWKKMQGSWNTAGQKQQSFGTTRML